MKDLTKSEFIEKVFDFENEKEWKFKGEKPAILDMWASWCNPCKTLAPTFEELSKEYEGMIDFYKINIEDEPEIASEFKVRSVPSIFFINTNGELPQLAVGALSKSKFKELIKTIFDIE